MMENPIKMDDLGVPPFKKHSVVFVEDTCLIGVETCPLFQTRIDHETLLGSSNKTQIRCLMVRSQVTFPYNPL